MNPEIKTAWLSALRSGKYAQTRTALRDTEGFCCLGVLCDLHATQTGGEWDTDGLGSSYLGVGGVLPVSVMGWAELPSNNPTILVSGDRVRKIGTSPEWHTLADLNDNGLSFIQIADLIETAL